MRFPLSHPDLSPYERRFDVPLAEPSSPVTVSWAGVTTLLIDDGESPVLTDGFFSRPSMPRVLTMPLTSSTPKITAGLQRLGVTRLAAVTPLHTHFDHALDTAAVASTTGAVLLGGQSAAQIGRGHGLDRIEVVTPNVAVTAAGFDLTYVVGHHCPPDRYPGPITTPLRQPARVTAYRCGESWSLHLRHRGSGRQMLIIGSAGYVRGSLQDLRADAVYLGVGQLGHQPSGYIREYWNETVRTVGARRVVLIHWDDYFRSLDRPLKPLPYVIDDLDASMRELTRLADADGVALHFPTPWQRTDPWR